MSKTFQKFELLKLRAYIEQESFKVIRIDDVVHAKENLQTIVNVIKHGKMLTRNQIRQAIDVIQDIKLREGVEFSISELQVTQILEEDLDFTKPLAINNENRTLVHLTKLYPTNLQINVNNEAAQKKLQKSYSNLIILAQLIINNNEFRALAETFFTLIKDLLKNNTNPKIDISLSSEKMKPEKSRKKAVTKFQKQKEDIKEYVYLKSNQSSSSKAETNFVGEHTRKASDSTDFTVRDVHRKSSKRNHARLVSDLTGITIQETYTKNKPITDKEVNEDTDQTKRGGSKVSNHSKNQPICINNEVKKNSGKINSKRKTRDKAGKDQVNEVTKYNNLDEQLKSLTDRLTDIIYVVQSHPEYRKALEGLFDVLYNIKNNNETLTRNSTSQIKTEGNVYLEELLNKAKKAVENFAGGYSLDILVSLMKELNEIVESDPKLHRLMYYNYKFILNVFKDKKYIHNYKLYEKTISNFQSTRRHLLKNYSGPLKRISTEATNFFDALRDPSANRNISNLENLTKELFLDNTGQPTIKYDLLQDFHKYVPILANRLRRLEIPRISRENDGVEYILDNISLTCDNILLKNVQIHTDAGFNSEQDRILNIISLKVQAIQASAQNITFYFKKKMLIGNIEDAGVVNVTIDKGGLDIFLKLSPRSVDPNSIPYNQPKFIVVDSKCQVNNINVKFQHGKFDLIYKMFNKTIQSTIKRQIKTIVSQGIRDFLEENDNVGSQNLKKPLNFINQLDNPLDLGPDGWKSKYLSTRN